MQTKPTYVGMVKDSTSELHIFKSLEGVMAAIKKLVSEGKHVEMSSYEWVRKGHNPAINYMLKITG